MFLIQYQEKDFFKSHVISLGSRSTENAQHRRQMRSHNDCVSYKPRKREIESRHITLSAIDSLQ